MSNLLFFLLFAFMQIYIFFQLRVLVKQYYSLKRLFIYLFAKKYNVFYLFGISLVYILALVSSHFFGENIGVLVSLILPIIFITRNHPKKYLFTRRSVLLLLMCEVVCLILSHLSYFILSKVITSLLLPFICLLSVCISLYLLYPFEICVKKYYIHKAKNKIKRNKYYVIGITGSYGKTTLKNIIYSLLKVKYKISDQNHNFNTLMGLCKYINNDVNEDDEILILELGVDHRNSMRKFKQITKLDVGIITAIDKMHLTTFKNINNIAKEKMKIQSLLKKDGMLYVSEEVKDNYKHLIKTKYQVFNHDSIKYDNHFYYDISIFDEVISTSLIHPFQLDYVSLAIDISIELGLNKNEIKYALKHISLPNRRSQIKKLNNFIVVDDSYNANPKGVESLIDRAKQVDGIRIIVLGGLFERGKDYYEDNFNLGKKLDDFNHIFFYRGNVEHPLYQGINNKRKVIFVNDLVSAMQRINLLNKKGIVIISALGEETSLN